MRSLFTARPRPMVRSNAQADASPRPRWRRAGTAALLSLAALAPAAGIAGLTSAPAFAVAPVCTSNGGTSTTCVFSYTGAPQSWTVPLGVASLTVEVVGAAGGRSSTPGAAGGVGGGVKATLSVVAGSTWQINVGGKGSLAIGQGGWNGGGYSYGGGGGGASDIRSVPYGPDQRLVDGGGGGAGINAGAGGGGGGGYGPGGSTNFTGTPDAHGSVKITYTQYPGWTRLAGQTPMGSDPTVSTRPGTNIQDVFYANAAGNVIHNTITNGVLGTEENLGGVIYPGSSIAAVSWDANRIDMFVRGLDSALWQRYWNGTTWSPWISHARQNFVLSSSPTVASRGSRLLDVFANAGAPGSSATTQAWTYDGTQWRSQWKPMTGTVTVATAPAAAAVGPDNVRLVGTFVDADGKTKMVRSSYNGTDFSSGWTDPTAFEVATKVAISSPGGNQYDTYFRGDAVDWLLGIHWDSNGGSSFRFDFVVPSPRGSGPAVVSVSYTKAVVFVRGADNQLWTRAFISGGVIWPGSLG